MKATKELHACKSIIRKSIVCVWLGGSLFQKENTVLCLVSWLHLPGSSGKGAISQDFLLLAVHFVQQENPLAGHKEQVSTSYTWMTTLTPGTNTHLHMKNSAAGAGTVPPSHLPLPHVNSKKCSAVKAT